MSLLLALVLAATPAPSTCKEGSLLFAPAYHPSDIALSPDGSAAVIADRGFLSVNEPATLKVRRYLLPQLNAWLAVKFIDDARVLAETVDGLRFEIDIRTGDAKRLPHSPDAQARELLEPATFSINNYPSAKALEESVKQSWAEMAPSLGNEDPLSGALPTAVSRGPEQELGVAIATEDGTLVLLDAVDAHVLARGKAPGQVQHLEVSRGEVLAVTRDGDVLFFDRALKLKASARVFTSELVGNEQPPRSSFHPPAPAPKSARRPKLLRHAPGRNELLWLSFDGAVGSFDLATGRNVARMEPTGHGGVSAGFLLGEDRLVLLAGGVLRVWDTKTGGIVKEKEEVVLAMPSGGTGLAALLGDGRAERLDAATGASSQARCLLPRGCEAKREATLIGLTAQGAPDGKRFAVLYRLMEFPSGAKWPEEALYLASFDASTLRLIAQVGLLKMERGYYPPSSFQDRGRLRVGSATYSFPALKLLEKAKEEPKNERETLAEDEESVSCPPGERICIIPHKEEGELPVDEVRVLDKKGRTLAILASLEQPGTPRAQHRRFSFAQVSQDKTRFLLASREASAFWPRSGYAGAVPISAGAAQVWCMPTAPMAPLPPE